MNPQFIYNTSRNLISDSRLFYLVYVMVELAEELVEERDIEGAGRVNPE